MNNPASISENNSTRTDVFSGSSWFSTQVV